MVATSSGFLSRSARFPVWRFTPVFSHERPAGGVCSSPAQIPVRWLGHDHRCFVPAHTTVEVHLESGCSLVDLLVHLEPSGVWIREGHGLIGLGTAASTAASGQSRFAQLSRWWESLPLVEDAAPLSSARTGSAPSGPD